MDTFCELDRLPNDDLEDRRRCNIFSALSGVAEMDGYVYIATPYTKYPYGQHKAATVAAFATAELMRGGIRAFSPIVHGHQIAKHGFDPLDVDFWISANAGFLYAASACIVVKMKGWQESKGIAAEIEHFLTAGKPIVYIGDEIIGGIE
jgi:hypothetical protein